MAVLEFLNGERVGDRLSVTGSQAVLGRHPECDIVLNEGAISRQHAKLSLRSGEYFIEDLQSRNGTIVNGELVEQASLEDLRQGRSLEDRFLERAGADAVAPRKISWLEEGAP